MQSEELSIFDNEHNIQHLESFLIIVLEFLNGHFEKRKAFGKAAKTMGVQKSNVTSAVTALSQLMLRCAKYRPRKMEFQSIVMTELKMSVDAVEIIWNFICNHMDSLEDILERSNHVTGVSFKELSWRLEIQHATRESLQEFKPVYTIALDTSDGKRCISQASFAALDHVHSQLKQALDELETTHSQRVMRYIR